MFVELFEKAFREEYQENSQTKSYDHNHPSGITKCPRQFWYRVKNTPITDEPSISMMLIWAQGYALQSVLEKYLARIPEIEEFHIEHPVKDEKYNVSGRVDLLVKINGKWFVLDFKTIGASNLRSIKQKKQAPEAYVWQVLLYMYLLKKQDPEKFQSLNTAYLLFINKSPIPDEIFFYQKKPWLASSPFYEVEVKYDEDIINTLILPQCEFLEEIREMDVPPVGDYHSDECKFCEYRTLCRKTRE